MTAGCAMWVNGVCKNCGQETRLCRCPPHPGNAALLAMFAPPKNVEMTGDQFVMGFGPKDKETA